MKYDDICTRKEYQSNEQKKVSWLKCGTLRTSDDGKRFIELNHLPGITFYVFEQKKKEAPTKETEWLQEDPTNA